MTHDFWLGWTVGILTATLILNLVALFAHREKITGKENLKDITFDVESKVKNIIIPKIPKGRMEWRDNTRMLPVNSTYLELISIILNDTPIFVRQGHQGFVLPRGFITSIAVIISSDKNIPNKMLYQILSDSDFALEKVNGENKLLHPVKVLRNNEKSFCFSLINPPGDFDLRNAITAYDCSVLLVWNYKGNITFKASFEIEELKV